MRLLAVEHMQHPLLHWVLSHLDGMLTKMLFKANFCTLKGMTKVKKKRQKKKESNIIKKSLCFPLLIDVWL